MNKNSGEDINKLVPFRNKSELMSTKEKTLKYLNRRK